MASKIVSKTNVWHHHPDYNNFGSFTIHYTGLSEDDVDYLENEIDMLLEQAESDRGLGDQ